MSPHKYEQLQTPLMFPFPLSLLLLFSIFDFLKYALYIKSNRAQCNLITCKRILMFFDLTLDR